jgi:hypothetical protein
MSFDGRQKQLGRWEKGANALHLCRIKSSFLVKGDLPLFNIQLNKNLRIVVACINGVTCDVLNAFKSEKRKHTLHKIMNL